jgi:replicative DNA helicase
MMQMAPMSEESEGALLGALLLEPIRVFGVVTREWGLTPDAFYVPANRLVAEAVWEDAATALDRLDVVTVRERMREAGSLEKAGGSKKLEDLLEACVTPAHCEAYAEVVKRKWDLRRLAEAGLEIHQEAMKPDAPVETVSWAAQRIAEVIPLRDKAVTNADMMRGIITEFRDAKAFQEGDESKRPAIGLELPWKRLNELCCGLEPGLTLLAGRPSAGKTTLEDMIAHHVAASGVGVLRVTLDSSRKELLRRALSRKSGCSLPKAKFGYAREDQLAEMAAEVDVLAGLPMWIEDDIRECSAICALAREMKVRRNIGLVTVDFIQLVRMSEIGRGQENANFMMGKISGALKLLGLELDVPVLALSQLSRASEQGNRPPDLTDLRDSGSLEQDASKVLVLWKHEKTAQTWDETYQGYCGQRWTKQHRPVMCGVLKHKDGETGNVEMILNGNYFFFEECGEAGFVPYGPKDRDGNLMVEAGGGTLTEAQRTQRGKGTTKHTKDAKRDEEFLEEVGRLRKPEWA